MSIRHLLRVVTFTAGLLCASVGVAQVVAEPQTLTRPYNASTQVTFSATDSTPGGPYPITWTIASPPVHGHLDAITNDGTTYHPDPGHIGQDTFAFTATTLNGTSAPAIVQITTLGPVPPVAKPHHYDVLNTTASDIPLYGHNPNLGSDPTVHFELVDAPTRGSVVFGDTNVVSYTPPLGGTGLDSFRFRVRHDEWGYSDVATVSIALLPPVPPVAMPRRSYVPHGVPTPIVLEGKDANPGGPYALSYAVDTQPAHGSVDISGDIATYTPGNGHSGEDGFSITVSSANGTSAPVAVDVLVGQPVTLGLPGGRNDSGQTVCTDSVGAAILCNHPVNHPGQDGRIGRDAQAGAAAFDFEAIGGGCVRDRVTGLVWSDESLLAQTWADANDIATTYDRCGIDSGWRLPTRRELLGIVHHGASQPAIDTAAFPATQSAPYWSGDVQGGSAWAVDFSDGGTAQIAQTEPHAARLVARLINEAPTITLGAAEIVLSNNHRPGPLTFPGWATGISPGPAREAGQRLFTTVRLLPVEGIKTLEFDVPPVIDPATGDLSFTVLHRIYPEGQLPIYDPDLPISEWPVRDVFYWVSSAGRVRVEVTLHDDGGTEGGGVDTTVKSFEIFVSPVPLAFDINIAHPWRAACIPVTMHAQDIDTDIKRQVYYPQRYEPLFKIKQYPSRGFLTDYVPRPAPASKPASRPASAPRSPSPSPSPSPKSISVPLGDTVDSVDNVIGTTGSRAPVPDPVSPWGFFAATICYVPFSTTQVGSDVFTYSAVDVDGNESEAVTVSIEIYEVR